MEKLMPDFLFSVSSSARRSLGGLKGLSSSSTESVVDLGARGVSVPDIEFSRLDTTFPPLLPLEGVQERFEKWPPRPPLLAGGAGAGAGTGGR